MKFNKTTLGILLGALLLAGCETMRPAKTTAPPDKTPTPEERAVIRSIIQLERVYMIQGRVNDVKPLLDHVKSKTSNATISAFVDRQLERIANRPNNPDQQIATLTQKLNDDIAKLQ